MVRPALCINVLANLATLGLAAPIPSPIPSPAPSPLPQSLGDQGGNLKCTNYPTFSAGSTITKRDTSSTLQLPTSEISERDSSPFKPAPLEISRIAPRAPTYSDGTQVSWCQKGSNMWLGFTIDGPIQGENKITVAAWSAVYNNALANITKGIDTKATIPQNTDITLGRDGNVSIDINGINEWTYEKAKEALQIMQNFIYVTRVYSALYAEVFEGGNLVGYMNLFWLGGPGVDLPGEPTDYSFSSLPFK